MCADKSYAPDCPTNFPGAHSTPKAETADKFKLCQSDTLNETGIAVLNHHDDLLGWIKKEDI
jgi:hypothetical protein